MLKTEDKFKTTDGRIFKIYNSSINKGVFMVDGGKEDFLVSDCSLGFKGSQVVCSQNREKKILSVLNHESAEQLRKIFPWTAPSRVLNKDRTMGTGDRLGIAGDGHIEVFKSFSDLTPVLAQQSIRELNLTGRTFSDVLDSSTFAVFRCGYKKPWGADGDHVKTKEDVEYALNSGFTMITLDCSDYIDNSILSLSDAEVEKEYERKCHSGFINTKLKSELESLYLNKSFELENNIHLYFDRNIFFRTVLVYLKAIEHIVMIWRNLLINNNAQRADFEISIDETINETLPEQHFFVASELARNNVKCSTVAPKFCGEFEKGIDYKGNINQFEKQIKIHAQIAEKFGYKLSIHSGSDKFAILRICGRQTHQHFHLKTAGTSYLEAMKLIALKNPALYREIHTYALSVFEKACKFYHVSSEPNEIPALSDLSDSELVKLFCDDNSRQLIHICYGFILNRKKSDGSFFFRDRMYELFRQNKEEYFFMLEKHIGHHAFEILDL